MCCATVSAPSIDDLRNALYEYSETPAEREAAAAAAAEEKDATEIDGAQEIEVDEEEVEDEERAIPNKARPEQFSWIHRHSPD
ncbi:hypothetical protein CL629_04215 [bacterium]|nr:hypothetical protein [bacterium]|tara:strand:- start:2299 stop:2547 length:249 start_codon:yes stop_codon:yes gene_type:complete